MINYFNILLLVFKNGVWLSAACCDAFVSQSVMEHIQKCNSTCVGTTILYLPKMEDILERAFAANNSISLSSTQFGFLESNEDNTCIPFSSIKW